MNNRSLILYKINFEFYVSSQASVKRCAAGFRTQLQTGNVVWKYSQNIAIENTAERHRKNLENQQPHADRRVLPNEGKTSQNQQAELGKNRVFWGKAAAKELSHEHNFLKSTHHFRGIHLSRQARRSPHFRLKKIQMVQNLDIRLKTHRSGKQRGCRLLQ